MKIRTFLLGITLPLTLSACYVVPVQAPAPPPPPGPAIAPVVAWQEVTIRATGNGAPPPRAVNPAQARLMTERAAKLDAYRNLTEQAYGLNISGRTNVKDFITQNDSIRARVDAYIRGARVVHTIHHDDGGVEVEMEVTLRQDFRQIFP